MDLSPIPVSALLSGGNADTVLDRVSGVVRNRKNKKRKGVDLGRMKGKAGGSSRKRRWTTLFIRPGSDHWQTLSVNNSLTPWRLVDLTDVTLALKRPTQNLLRFLLFLMLMLRKMLTPVGADLVIKLDFCSDIEHKI